MARKKFQRKRNLFLKNDSRFNSQIIHKSVFLIGQVPIKIMGLKPFFAFQHIENRKSFIE